LSLTTFSPDLLIAEMLLMPDKIEILNRKYVLDRGFFRVEEAQLRHEKYDGTMSDPLTRLVFERGDSVAAVVHDSEHDTLIFTEQFRYPTVAKDTGWLLEIPAGSMDKQETPEDCLRREIEEEIGYTIGATKFISTFYVSPGGTSERIHLFYVGVTSKERTGEGGGVAGEGENIHIVTLPVNDVLQQVAAGKIHDAKTLVGLLWFQLNRANLG
jgi:nudix-type nucleoside diphosphatase (YffH/AdpP family)